jgi:hypothetical protein
LGPGFGWARAAAWEREWERVPEVLAGVQALVTVQTPVAKEG